MILDSRGNPIERKELDETQSASIMSLAHEFANHPSRGLTPGKLARILEDAERGDLLAQCDLFDDMEEKDGHIFAEMAKRKRSLMGLEWQIKPPRNATSQEEKATEEVNEILAGMNDLEDVIFDMADAIGKGFACLEFENGWDKHDGDMLPNAITFRPQRWFTTPQGNHNEIRLRSGGSDGEKLWEFGWIVHTHKARSGYVGRSGLHRTLSWPYLFKNYSIRDLAEFLEIYGLPLRLGKYNSGASDKEKAALLRAVVNIGHDAAGIIPQGMDIDFTEAAKGTKDPFEAMINWCERTQSKAITGTTAPNEGTSSGGNRSLGDYSKEVLWDITVSDARQIASTSTRDLIWPITVLNTSITDPSRSPRMVFDTQQPEDLKLYSESLPKLAEMGMKIPRKWAQEKLRIPEPEDDDEILGRTSSVTVPTEVAKNSMATLRQQNIDRDLADNLADQLEAESNAEMTAIIDQVRTLVNKAESFAALKNDLYEAFNYLDENELAKVMRMAFATAELGGRYEGQEGI